MTSITNDDVVSRQRSAAEATRHAAARRRWLRLLLMVVLPAVLLIAGGWWYLISGRYVATDDAYVQADTGAVSTDVAGRVAELDVRDNQLVKRGQLLFRLDDRPFRIAVERAQAQLAAARLQVDGLRASYREKQSELKEAEDTLAFQQREFARQQQLVGQHVVSQSAFDQARNNLDRARQQVASTEQQIANVLASLGGNPDLPTERHPLVEEAQAQLDAAQLNVSYTIVRAPFDGIVTKVDKLPVGSYLNVAQPAFSLVATENVWVEANYKETELTHMRPGQSATVTVDAYPGVTFEARVASLSPGTGSEFSVLPAQNATGNWVKVVQRLPVRLALVKPDAERPLRAGMSVTAEVDTGYVDPLLARIKGIFGFGAAARGAPR